VPISSRTYPSWHRHIVSLRSMQISIQTGFGFEQSPSHGTHGVGTSFSGQVESDGVGLAENTI